MKIYGVEYETININKQNSITDITIVCFVYNFAPYIKNAFDSFMKQKLKYCYEVIVIDDASTDGSSDIVREYSKKYPNCFRGFIAKKNTYCNKDRNKIYWEIISEYAKGTYIAICEGDDCWIDIHKLQIQIDFMKKNNDVSMTVHNSSIINFNNHTFYPSNTYSELGNRYLTAKDIIVRECGNIPTASIVVKKQVYLERPLAWLCAGCGDFPLHIYSLAKGKIYYFDRIMSVYRSNHQASFSTRTYKSGFNPAYKHIIDLIDLVELMNGDTNYNYNIWFVIRIQQLVSDLFYFANTTGYEEIKNLILNSNYDKNSERTEELIRVFRQMNDISYLQPKAIELSKNCKYLYIYGAGNYGHKIAEQLYNNNIRFDGFIVSDNQYIDEKDKEKIFHIGEIKEGKKEIGIIVGVNPFLWDQIRDNIIDMNFVAPLMYDITGMLKR